MIAIIRTPRGCARPPGTARRDHRGVAPRRPHPGGTGHRHPRGLVTHHRQRRAAVACCRPSPWHSRTPRRPRRRSLRLPDRPRPARLGATGPPRSGGAAPPGRDRARRLPDGWTYHAASGDPARLIAAVADETDALMIIVGSHGEGTGATFDRLLAGSVSRMVLRRQHRPVLIVPSAVSRNVHRVLAGPDDASRRCRPREDARYELRAAPCEAPPGSRDHPGNVPGHRTSDPD